MGHDLGIRLCRKAVAFASKLLPKLTKILDNAVVDDRQPVARMGMRIGLAWPAMRRPAGMADADDALERRFRQAELEVLELTLGAPARQVAGLQRSDAGRVIAAVFEPLQRL
jgi:hypothetical protein